MNRRVLLPSLAGIGVLAALGVSLALRPAHIPDAAGTPQIGGPFALTDGAGTEVTSDSYRGKWRLVYFGYTHCPDACPTTLGKLGAALDHLPAADRAQLRVLFITVDPARDTPAVMRDYAHAFGAEFIGLTGTQAELTRVEDEFHVYAKRHDLSGGDYAMDHSSVIYVMHPDGAYAGLLDDAMSPAELARQLTALQRAGVGA